MLLIGTLGNNFGLTVIRIEEGSGAQYHSWCFDGREGGLSHYKVSLLISVEIAPGLKRS